MTHTNDTMLSKAYNQAAKMAETAKPWILKYEGSTYTAVFNSNEWVYDVYENGFFMMKINMKQASKAKAFLLNWLQS